jgi:hypothetical protein
MSDIRLYTEAQANNLVPLTGDVILCTEPFNFAPANSVHLAVVGGASPTWKSFANDAEAEAFLNEYSTKFDGVDEYVTVGDISALSSSNAFTVSAHFKAVKASRDIVGFRGFYIRPNTSGMYGRINKVYEWSNVGGDIYYGQDQWHHVIVVWNSPNITCYVDGNEIINSNMGFAGATSSDNGNLLKIGARYNGISARFDGNIDEVAVWSKALSSTEVNAISGGVTDLSITAADGLAHWWRMGDGDGSGPTVTDQVGGVNGTLTNGATIENVVPTYP